MLVQAVGRGRVFGAGRIELGQRMVQGFQLLLHLAQVREDGHAFGEDGAAGERQAVLRQIARA